MRLIEEIARSMAAADSKGQFWEQYEVHARKVISALKHADDRFEPPIADFTDMIDAILDEKAS